MAAQGTYVQRADTITSPGFTISAVDSSGSVGLHASIALGADGLGLVSYRDGTNGDLKVAHCNNAVCSSATLSTLDSTGTVGVYTSVAIGVDGLALISYYGQTNGDLKVAHCANVLCTTANVSSLDVAGDVGSYSSVAIGTDGLGLIKLLRRIERRPESGALREHRLQFCIIGNDGGQPWQRGPVQLHRHRL